MHQFSSGIRILLLYIVRMLKTLCHYVILLNNGYCMLKLVLPRLLPLPNLFLGQVEVKRQQTVVEAIIHGAVLWLVTTWLTGVQHNNLFS